MQANRQSSRGHMEAAHRSSQIAESCKLLSYRVGVLILIVLAILLVAGAVVFIAELIDTAHVSRSF